MAMQLGGLLDVESRPAGDDRVDVADVVDRAGHGQSSLGAGARKNTRAVAVRRGCVC